MNLFRKFYGYYQYKVLNYEDAKKYIAQDGSWHIVSVEGPQKTTIRRLITLKDVIMDISIALFILLYVILLYYFTTI